MKIIMSPVAEKLVKDVQAVVEVRNIIAKRKNGGNKSPAFVPVDEFSQSSREDRLTIRNKPIDKPVKNLHLVEGDPPETEGILKKREMRCFPNEDCLSAKIRIANGTDYSNHFIEQHYNRRALTSIRKCKKISKNFAVIGLLKKKKIFPDNLGLEFEKKAKSSLPINKFTQNMIADSSDSSGAVEIIDHKNIENNSTRDKCELVKAKEITLRHKLVPYSSSENESDGDGEGCFH